ncbi:hypothetical protein Halhy_6440 [Haliscomenobacter hydrossis DSM 1100]|uniref:Uncharacterized protein n=1 Tax=Haliscomenobacter hydrossis (strain ATCC 27775 / DSM 1100 / LMG 10767 / O) TaxID=760192 RepID=F4KR71_HALH1|nr:hypothetical protein Halhy_6440 [Haliscomenobacter hydrossis DSM 1100]
MTRMRRIYADFYHAFGAIRIRLATKAESPKKLFSIQPALSLGFFVAKKLCRRQSKIRVNPLNPRHPRCYYSRFSMDKEG